MTDTVYALTQRHLIFDGTNLEDFLVVVRTSYPNATITASANYPGASASVSMDLFPGFLAETFNAGDSWGYATSGRYPRAVLEDTGIMVPLADFVRANAPAPALAVGYGVTPNILVGASATVTVPMVPALPDAGYNVAVALAGSSQLLGSLQILGHTVVGASAVDVNIRNNGILALAGATVLVTALHNG